MAETPKQRRTVGRVMRDFKHGELERSQGGKVKDRRQAIAIALSESGASNRKSERKTAPPRAGRSDSHTRKALYERARRKGVQGRSRMSKSELKTALGLG